MPGSLVLGEEVNISEVVVDVDGSGGEAVVSRVDADGVVVSGAYAFEAVMAE